LGNIALAEGAAGHASFFGLALGLDEVEKQPQHTTWYPMKYLFSRNFSTVSHSPRQQNVVLLLLEVAGKTQI
jgi:hypothetical protein